MFRKIVSNIAFSPALVGQLSFYTKRLRKEEITRRLGLLFTVMALIVQSLAVFSPPEAANASSNADFVRGGVSSVKDFLKYYDKNSNHIKSIYNSLGITRAEVASAKYTVIGESSRYNWAMTSLYSYAQGQRSWDYGSGKAYYRPMRLTQEGGDRHPVYASYSKSIGWFAIKKDCGNLITASVPHPPKPVAACSNLDVVVLSSTRFRFNAKASHKNGAKITSYSYDVHNSGGKSIKKLSSKSSQTTNHVDYTQTTPGSYTVYLTVYTSVGKKQDSDCRGKFIVSKETNFKPQNTLPENGHTPIYKPVAACKSLQAIIQDRTMVALTGSATAEHGATVSQYTFVVKNSSGAVIKTIPVKSNKLVVSAPSIILSTPGAYTVTLTVTTSVGQKTDSTDCAKSITITPPQVCTYNPQLSPNSPDCQPCPDNPDIWIKDEKCTAVIINTKTATNLTQGNIVATTKKANARDKISYTLKVENQGLASDNVTIKESLHDVLQYATLIDSGGGSYSKSTQTLEWPKVSVAAKSQQSRSFVVQMMNKIPLTNTGTSDATSYDCRMTNTYGNTVEINVNCPKEKLVVERTVAELPHTGPRENMIFAGVLFAVVAYFYARSRQLGSEVRLVRRNVNAGAI